MNSAISVTSSARLDLDFIAKHFDKFWIQVNFLDGKRVAKTLVQYLSTIPVKKWRLLFENDENVLNPSRLSEMYWGPMKDNEEFLEYFYSRRAEVGIFSDQPKEYYDMTGLHLAGYFTANGDNRVTGALCIRLLDALVLDVSLSMQKNLLGQTILDLGNPTIGQNAIWEKMITLPCMLVLEFPFAFSEPENRID